MNTSFEGLKTGFSFNLVTKVVEFHGKYEVTFKNGEGTHTLIFNESDISHR